MELHYLTATELSGMLKQKKISSAELVKDTFSRIEKVEDKVKAYITLCKEDALEKAAQVDKKIANNEELPLLAGIPIGVKDNICTKGIKTTCASKMLENFVPPYNATVIEKINDNHMIITGKLNLDEFAMGSSCENSAFYPTHNPHDLNKVPGGSSGGSGASVAAGECPVSLGSDTGGSIRLPAQYCGIAGLKPTYGAVSRFGLVAFASSLDQIGPLTRSISDMAHICNLLYGYDPKDSTSLNVNHKDFAQALTGDVKGLRIGIPRQFMGEGIKDSVKKSVQNAAKELEKLGAVIKEFDFPVVDYALPAYYILSSAQAASNLARYDGVKYGYRAKEFDNLIDMYCKTRSEAFGKEVKRRIMLGNYVLSSGYYDAYYKKAMALERYLKNEYQNAFNDYDIILTPSSPDTAFRINERTNDPIKMYLTDICTVSVNIAGLPAISVPCGKDEENMPIGLQLIGKKLDDFKLLQVAYTYEQQCKIWDDMQPALTGADK